MAAPTVFSDAYVVAKRNIIKIKRVPDLLVFTTLSPIMFVLLFAFVFGGAIAVPGGTDPDAYREFLMAGIFAQTVIFGATITGAGLAEDVKKGIIDRFRSLPMAPSAVLTGRTISDVANNVLVLDRHVADRACSSAGAIHSSPVEAALGFLLLLIFAYAISWIMAWLGMLVPSVEVFNNATFIVIFPLTFVANTFVPLETLPAPPADVRGVEPGLGGDAGRRASCSATSPTGVPDAGRVVAAEPGALHADLVRDLHRRVRPAGELPVPALDQPLTHGRRPPRRGEGGRRRQRDGLQRRPAAGARRRRGEHAGHRGRAVQAPGRAPRPRRRRAGPTPAPSRPPRRSA